jgi:selenocysteine lyase/cysteine desulfurase
MEDSFSRRAFLGALSAGTLASNLASAQAYPADRVPVVSRELWAWARSQLLLGADTAWFDTARFGPALRAVVSRAYRSLERQSLDFPRYYNATFGPDAIGSPLADIGVYLGADPADIVLTSGAGEGLALVAQGLDLQSGDEVLTTAHDHDSAVYPWLVQAKRRGIKVVQLPQDGVPAAPEAIVGRFAGAITPKTRVVLFSHVQYTDGTVMPVKEICALARANNAFSVVDGAQAAGLVDFALRDLGCDAYATCFHKWLNGPAGSGALYLRRESQPRLWPALAQGPQGWDTVDRYGATLPAADPAASAQEKFGALARYRGPEYDALSIAFEFQQTVNRARIGMRIRELVSYLRLQLGRLGGVQILTPTHPSLWSGIVALRVAGRDHEALARSMAQEDNIVVGHVRHGAAFDALRVSLHPTNDSAEIDRLVTAIQRRL